MPCTIFTKIRTILHLKPQREPLESPPAPPCTTITPKPTTTTTHLPIHDIFTSHGSPFRNPTRRRCSYPSYRSHHCTAELGNQAVDEVYFLRTDACALQTKADKLQTENKDLLERVWDDDGYIKFLHSKIERLLQQEVLVKELRGQLERYETTVLHQAEKIAGLEAAERVVQSLLLAQHQLKTRIRDVEAEKRELEYEKRAQQDVLRAVKGWRSWAVPRWCFKAPIAELSLRLLGVQASLKSRDEQIRVLRVELAKFRRDAPEESPVEVE